MALINRHNTLSFHRRLYAPMLEKVRLHKRGPDQQQGTVKTYVLFQCRRSRIGKTGEPINEDNTSNHSTVWHVPRTELIRTGISYLSALDLFEQLEGREKGWFWQPEATTMIDLKLMGNHYCLACLRTDPPIWYTAGG